MKSRTLFPKCFIQTWNRSLLACGLATAFILPASASLTHRYSFATDASDSVGGGDGTLMNGAAVSGGAVVLSGATASGPGCDYVELPPGLISNYTAVTFEMWIDPGTSGTWAELYAFGNQNAGNAGANMVMFSPHTAPDDFRMSYAQADPGYNDEHVTRGGGILDGTGPCSITCVYDPPNNTLNLYRNGALVSTLSPVTTGAKAFSLTNVYNVNSWLGRSMYNGDGSYGGTIDEFRIYDTALSQVQVAIDSALGPDVVATNFSIVSGAFIVNTNMIIGERQDSSATLSFTYNGSKTGTATVIGFKDPVYSSSDTNVIVITSAGRLFAMSPGSATVSAVYSGQTFNKVVTVSATPNLLHRYSFASDASDSVGTAHGTLMGGATISGGAVVLSGAGSSGAPGDYVDLPNFLFTNLTSVSLETWVTDNGSATWARIWDFGCSIGGEDTSTGGGDNLWLCTPSGGGTLRAAIDNGAGETDLDTSPLGVGKESHVIWVNDSAHHTSSLYVNGVLAAQNLNTTLTPADLGLTFNDWLGRSQYNDPLFNGSIDEFRIWQGPLSPLQVAINLASGPDKVGTNNPGAVQAVRLTVNPAMIKGGQQGASVSADFASVSNVVITTAGAVYTSGDTNILTVSPAGVITAVGAGSATVTASYGGKSDSKSITVSVKPPVLVHRWDFHETSGTTVHDLVGTANGTLSAGGATLDGTAVTLDGISGYVDLPGHLIDGFDAVTFETWITVDPNTLNDSSARLFVLGSTDAVNEVGMTALTGGGNTYVRYFSPTANLGMLRQKGLNTLGAIHLVAEFNPPKGTLDLFLNGHWQNSLTNFAFSLASITNLASRLGANLGGTNFTAVAIDEFRIYSGTVDLLGIRADFAAGPNVVATNLGAPTSLQLSVDASMVQGSLQIPHAKASFTNAPNVDMSQTTEIAYSSSDPTVVSVTPDGLLQAVGVGSATVTASYSGKSSAKTVTVFPKQTMLVHRYSFTNDASDSVGAQDGYAWGNATVSGGQVVFSGDPNGYVELPSRLVSSLDSVTFEFWASIDPGSAEWGRIFDFGQYTDQADGGGESYVFFTPNSSTPGTRICLSDGAEAFVDFTPPITGYQNAHLVVIFDPTTNTQLIYTNGVLAASGTLNGKLLSNVHDVACWLGRSMYRADPGFTGSIDEFRLYAGAFTAAQVAADLAAGPDKVVLAPPKAGGPKLAASVSGGNLVVSWAPAGGHLESNAKLNNAAGWTTVGSANPSSIPLVGGPMFFRVVVP